MRRLRLFSFVAVLMICISAAGVEAAGYWVPDGNAEFCNPHMPPRAGGGVPAGQLHNGAVKGNMSGYTYQENRDWGIVTRWDKPVHEYVQWAAGFSGFPNQIAAGELVPIKASLNIYANTYRGTGSHEYYLVNQVYFGGAGCTSFPHVGPPFNSAVFANTHLYAGDGGQKSASAVNQYVRMPDKSNGSQVNLTWRMGWGISDGGPKDTDWVVMLQRYKWVEGTAGRAQMTIHANYDRPGSDYKRFASNSYQDCAEVCQHEDQCRAFTWVKPGVQAQSGVCWLKSSAPGGYTNSNTVSGIKQ